MKTQKIFQLIDSISKDEFRRALAFSIVFHIVLFFVAIIFNSLDINFDIFPKFERDVVTIKSSVKVDIVGMPKYTVQELKKMKLPAISTVVKGGELFN